MNTSKNEIEFVEFRKCDSCKDSCDCFCVSCQKFYCERCLKYCVQCEQPVCEGCFIEDKCCLVRPWGEKTEDHLRNFYQNKLLDKDGMGLLGKRWTEVRNKHRSEILKRSIAHYVENFDAYSFDKCQPDYIREFFPRITKYVENEETRLRFVAFMKELFLENVALFASAFMSNTAREDLFLVMDESIRSNQRMQGRLIYYAMISKELFDSMEKKGNSPLYQLHVHASVLISLNDSGKDCWTGIW